MENLSDSNPPSVATTTTSSSTPESPQRITFEEFQKVDIRAAKVIEAGRVPNSNRLLRLKLDLGGQEKQCVAGIGAKYDPDYLKGKMIAVVTNLVPRNIMGLISEVMLLAASEGPEISVLVLDKELGPGSRVR